MYLDMHQESKAVPMADSPLNEGVARAIGEAKFAYEKLSSLQEHMCGAGVDPYKLVSISDFRRIPTTAKSIYRANFPDGVVAPSTRLNDPMVARLQSSGTEGDRLVTVVHAFTLAQRMATCLRMNRHLKFLLDAQQIRTCRYAAPNCSDVECANPNSTMQDRMLRDGTLVLPVYHDLLATPDTLIQRALHEIGVYKPNCLYVDPTHIAHLLAEVDYAEQVIGKDAQLAVLCSYNLFTKNHRARLTRLFGPNVPIVNVLALSEFGFVAVECEHGALHLNNTDYYAEILDADGAHVPADTPGDLCITSIGDRLSPKIRYRTGDVLSFRSGACTCGSKFPVIDYFGRDKNSFRLASGVVVYASDVDDVIGVRSWLRLYQLTKLVSGRYILRCIPASEPEQDELTQLRTALCTLLESDDVRVEMTDYIASERGGKFLTCKNNYNNRDQTA
jgi:phenylacetate-CoA ligase